MVETRGEAGYGRAVALILTWLPEANFTRFAQLDYIAQHNAKAAISMDDLIEKQTAQLEQHPDIGRPGRKEGTRELVISHTSFVVIYRVRPLANRVEILRVLHTSQAWPK